MFSSNTSQASSDANYIEDVFSTYLYTGNGSTQTINNGIDLAGKGGLVWGKGRSIANDNCLFDTARGATKRLFSNNTDSENTSATSLTSFNSNGFSLGGNAAINASGSTFVSWTFRKQPKFFDVVTWSGNDTTLNISHNLGSVPGCIIVKTVNATSAWNVWHRGLSSGNYIRLNTTAAQSSSGAATLFGNNSTTVDPTSTVFTVGSGICADGQTYVAYLFAHDAGGFGLTGTDSVISCGSYNGNGDTQSINLGWEPQWLLVKKTTVNDINSYWVINDNMRGSLTANGNVWGLQPNTNANEDALGGVTAGPRATATGFQYVSSGLGAYNDSGQTYIYIAIRRGPMKTPTSGTSVYTSSSRTGTAGVIPRWTAGFPVDWALRKSDVTTGGGDWQAGDRLRGAVQVKPNLTEAETSANPLYTFDSMTGYSSLGATGSDTSDRSWMFRRAPGFFDEVCYTGTGSVFNVSHNLGVTPELIISKCRNAAVGWITYHKDLGNTGGMYLNSSNGNYGPVNWWNSTSPTASQFTHGASTGNYSGEPVVTYLFASCPGVSKVGSVTHVEPTTVSCGFIPRFILIKSTTATGTDDWFVFDSARGLVPGNDPYLRLNSTGAENTPFGAADLVDVTSDGFIMNGFGGGNYIYLAIA